VTTTHGVEEGRADIPDERIVRRREGRTLSEKFNAVAFWFLAAFLLGACVGIGTAFKYHSTQLDRSISLGCFVHDGVVYQVAPKPQK
jgi:hypothetical protein